MPGQSVWNKRAKAGPKVRRQNESLKESSFLSLHFFFSMVFFSFLLLEEKKMPRQSVWNKRAKSGR
jgi:hypothetical protein